MHIASVLHVIVFIYLTFLFPQVFQDYAFKENFKDINDSVDVDFETVRYTI